MSERTRVGLEAKGNVLVFGQMDSGFFWILILEDFIKWSPLIMIVFGACGLFAARKKSKRVKIVSMAAGVFLPVIWVISVVDFFLIAAIAGANLGQDFGFTDRFDLSLHNNYGWTAMDSTDDAIIYNKVEANGGDLSSIPYTPESAWNVLEIQERGDWLAGSLWVKPSEKGASGWFLLNTRTHQRIDAKSERDLRADAAEKGIELHLQSCREFYLSRRFSWTAILEIVLLLVFPVVGLDLLRKLAVKFVGNQTPFKARP